MNAAGAIAIFAAAAVAGWLLRLVWARFAADDARWLLWILTRQEGRGWLHYRVEDNVVPAALGYPILFHWALARLPRRLWVRAGFAINALCDVIVAGIVFVTVVAVWARPDAACVAALLVLGAPCYFPPTSRLMAFNGRAAGLLLYVLFCLALAGYAVAGSWASLVAAGVLLALIVLTSQFAFQAAVPTLLAVSIAFGSVAIALVPTAFVAAAWLVRPIGLREPLAYFAGLYRWQYANRHNDTAPAVRSRWLRMTVQAIFVHRQWSLAWRWLLLHSPIVCSILYGPVVLAVGWMLVARDRALLELLADPAARFCLAAAAAMVATALATSFQPLSIFGQAERYLEFATPFAAVLVALRSPGAAALCALAAASAAVIAINLAVTAVLRRRDPESWRANLGLDRPAFLDWLPAGEGAVRLLTVPMSRAPTLTLAATREGARPIVTIYDWLSFDGEPPLSYMSRSMVGQRYTPHTLRQLAREHEFQGFVLFKKEAWVLHEGRPVSEPAVIFSEFDPPPKLAGEDGRYALYWSESR